MNGRYLLPILTLKDNGGGAVALALARACVATGADVEIISSAFHGVGPVSRDENYGIRFRIVPSVFNNAPLSAACFLIAACIYSVLTRRRVIYTHIITGLIPSVSRERPIWLAQDVEYRFFSGRARFLAKVMFRALMKRSVLLVTSIWLGKYFSRCGSDVAFVADVGISQKFLVAKPVQVQRDYDCFLIAKSGAHKRHMETCQVAAALADKGFRVFLIDQANTITSKSPYLTVEGSLPQAKVRELFRRSLVFISLSRAEGYGLTPLEALSQGATVLCTPTPSTANINDERLHKIVPVQRLVASVVSLAEREIVLTRQALDRQCIGYNGPTMESWAGGAARSLAA